MSVTITVQDKYIQILEPLGDIQQAVEAALRRYSLEQISAKIEEMRRRDQAFQAKYSCTYTTFVRQTANIPEYVDRIEQTIDKLWENDLAEWEFCYNGTQEWLQHLCDILTS